jgi:excisionase family DNA binding protein
MNTDKLLFSRKDSAGILGFSVRTLDYMMADGQLEFRKVGRKILIPRTALTRFASGDHPIKRTRKGGSR